MKQNPHVYRHLHDRNETVGQEGLDEPLFGLGQLIIPRMLEKKVNLDPDTHTHTHTHTQFNAE